MFKEIITSQDKMFRELAIKQDSLMQKLESYGNRLSNIEHRQKFSNYAPIIQPPQGNTTISSNYTVSNNSRFMLKICSLVLKLILSMVL